MSTKFLEVMNHHTNGGIVESKLKEGVEWAVDRQPKWNFEKYNYRKQPRVFYIGFTKRGHVAVTSEERNDLRITKVVDQGGYVITVVEKVSE